jgi:hypothetical protein
MALARAYAVGLYTEDGQHVRQFTHLHSFVSHFFLAACSCSHPDTRALSLVPFSSHCAHASYGGKIPIMMRAWQEVDEVAVLAGGMHRSLVLVMDRDVAGHHIAKGQAGI